VKPTPAGMRTSGAGGRGGVNPNASQETGELANVGADTDPDRSAWLAYRGEGLRARKRLGQHFLADRRFLTVMVGAAELLPSDDVLEIGPGLGPLTAALSRTARSVLAVELDESLVSVLQRRFSADDRVIVRQGNALDLDPCQAFAGPYKLVANIPYYITGPLLRHFLTARCQPLLAVLMVQREVAQRMAAQTGEMSLLAVSVQYYAAVKLVAKVPARAFSPRPKVDSAIVRLDLRRKPDEDWDQEFFAVVRSGFSSRRKQLRNSVAAGLSIPKPEAERLLEESGIDPAARAQTVAVDAWERLARAWVRSR